MRSRDTPVATLLYNIYKPDSTVWGSNFPAHQITATSLSRTFRLNSQGEGDINIPIRARLERGQTAPVGVYESLFPGSHTHILTSRLSAASDCQLASLLSGTLVPFAVNAIVPSVAPRFSKAFSPATVAPGEFSTLTYTINNSRNDFDVGSLAFDDEFPLGIADVPQSQPVTNCGGTITRDTSNDRLSLRFASGSVAAGETCRLSVVLQNRQVTGGRLSSISGALTSDLPDDAPGAGAILTVTEAPLSTSISFTPAKIRPGSVSTLTYRLRNDTAIGASSISLSDMLPVDVVVASEPNPATTCVGGAVSAPAGGDTIAFAEGSLAEFAECTISVDVTSAAPGSYRNATDSVTSSLGASAPAEATLTVDAAEALGFSKAFSPATVDPGGVSTMTFTIDNTANAIAVGGYSLWTPSRTAWWRPTPPMRRPPAGGGRSRSLVGSSASAAASSSAAARFRRAPAAR